MWIVAVIDVPAHYYSRASAEFMVGSVLDSGGCACLWGKSVDQLVIISLIEN